MGRKTTWAYVTFTIQDPPPVAGIIIYTSGPSTATVRETGATEHEGWEGVWSQPPGYKEYKDIHVR